MYHLKKAAKTLTSRIFEAFWFGPSSFSLCYEVPASALEDSRRKIYRSRLVKGARSEERLGKEIIPY